MSGCAPACSIRSIPRSARSSIARSTATARCRAGWRSIRLGASRRRGRRPARRARCFCARPRWSARPITGVTGQGLRLACAEPGDQLAIFGEALRELTERAAFLYEEAGRYWFSTQPTLNRLAEDRARAFPDHEVDDAIIKMLAEDAGTHGGFSRVFPPTDDPTTIDEAPTLSLVILGPSTPHAGRGVGQEPRDGHGDRRAHALPRVAAQVSQYAAVRRGRRGAACHRP